MSRNRRFPHLLLLAALLCASFASAAVPPTAAAADHLYRVDSARDTGGGTQAACKDTITTNKSCTLRQALTFAASDGGTSEIQFIIPALTSDPDWGYNALTKTWTISPTTALPPISANDTTITGKGTIFVPQRIVIDGSKVPAASAIGLRITSSNNVIRQLAVINFDRAGTNGVGILISGANAQNNQILLSSFQGNSNAGIKIDNSASNNIIGAEGDFNIISDNGTGIRLTNANTNTIQGNYIGLGIGSSSFVALGNKGDGVWLDNSNGNTIGGEGDARNIISANTKSGVLLSNGSANNTVFGNFIGTDEFGQDDLGNGQDGVQIINGATNNTISGGDFTHSVIGGNGGYGVLISDASTTGNKLIGTFIGVTDDGLSPLANTLDGVRIRDDAANNTVGGAGQGNVISGNGGYGVALGGPDGFTQIFSNTIATNMIGLGLDGTTAVANSAGGVLLDSGSNQNRVGGSGAALQNVISGNGGPGVVVTGTATLNNVIAGNVIGLRRNSSGKLILAAPNSGDGVRIGGEAQGTRIGGTTLEANVIAANSANGVHISGSSAMTTTIQSNLIGATKDGATFVYRGNGQNGVLVDGSASKVTIDGSTIFSNTLNGVLVTDGAQQVKVINTGFSRNGAKAIELDPETSGAPGDSANPNHDIDPPFSLKLDQARLLTGRVLADGSNAACSSCTIQIFTPDPAHIDGQGRDKVNVAVSLTSNGYFTATLPTVPPQVLVSATDGAGNTSEFALFERFYEVAIVPPRPQQQAVPGQTVTFTHFVTNTGTIAMTDLVLTATSKLKWPLTVAPTAPFGLAARTSRPVTLTLTLPTGSDPRIYAGLIDQARLTVRSTSLPTVTASITDTTLVLPKFLLAVTPPTLNALAKKGNIIPFVHKLTNNGNITTTVLLAASTNLGWATGIGPKTYLLRPGEAINATTLVTVPQTVVAPTIAKTTIKITSPSQPDRTQDKILTDTITITSTTLAIMTPAGYERDATAGETITLSHVVTNLSNGPATFKLFVISSSQGSSVVFRSNTPGITLGPGNSFTLGIDPTNNQLNFAADITINPLAVTGSTDTITIGLTNGEGTIIGGASVEESIRIAKGQIRPWIWLPMIAR
jgi:Periplasmic copper-binding protein (NosD)